MISTTKFKPVLSDVSPEWIFEQYITLPERLGGQNIMVLSPFNPNDKRPSLSLFVSLKYKDSYRFKCFSTNQSGDAICFVETLFKLGSRNEAVKKILQDYEAWLNNKDADHSSVNFKVVERYKVTSFAKRNWTTLDQKFWTKFHIGTTLLNKYYVFPLSTYTMSREDDGQLQEIVIKDRHFMYGYFREDGTLYKIYQPMIMESKFIKVRDYIQGMDQLTYSKPYLVLNSSLKDVMFFDKLGYSEAETIAPDSENTLILPHVINSLKLKYKGIATLFDNDPAGIKAMENYEKTYGIKGVLLPLSKDLSDSGKDHGILKVKQVLTPILKQALQ
jgi:hypothetical protein